MNESNSPLVTVIVASYNHAEYITQTIESILNQTYKNIELIVIDDGSTDDSVSVIKELNKKYDFIFISRANKGLTRTLNDGLLLSKGKYISIVGSDDYWDFTKIEKQVDFMNKNDDKNVKMLFTEFYGINHLGEKLDKFVYSLRKNPIYDFENVFYHADLPLASFFIEKKIIEQAGGYNEELKIEDFYIWLKVLEAGGYAKVINEPLAYYRFHDRNTYKDTLMLTKEHFKIVKIFINKSKNPKKILRQWSLRNADLLAINHKIECLKYFKYYFLFFDASKCYKILYKLLFVWRINEKK